MPNGDSQALVSPMTSLVDTGIERQRGRNDVRTDVTARKYAHAPRTITSYIDEQSEPNAACPRSLELCALRSNVQHTQGMRQSDSVRIVIAFT
eukprot:8905308-Pyramimonas_sp.AAC.1